MMLYLRILAIVIVVCIRPCDGDDTALPRYEALARIVQAAHTTDLPAIDRVEIFALSLAKEEGDASRPESEAFLVRPARVPLGSSQCLSFPFWESAQSSRLGKPEGHYGMG